MPDIQTIPITIDNFFGGLAEVDLDSKSKPGEFGFCKDMDVLGKQDFLTPHFAMIDDSTGIAAGFTKVRGYVSEATGAKKFYCIAHGLNVSAWESRLYGRLSLTSSWALIKTETTANTSTEPPHGLWEYGGKIYFFASPTVISEYDVDGDSLTDAWDDLNVAAWGSATSDGIGMLKHTDGNLFIYKGQYFGVYDGTTKPSLVTPIDLPSNFTIVDAISSGNKILIAANDKNSAGPSKIFLYDPYAPLGLYTFQEVFNTNAYRIQTLRVVEGELKVVTALNDLRILNWEGGDTFVPEKTMGVGGRMNSFAFVRPSAVATRDNVMYFGTHNSRNAFVKNGIYAYGRRNPDRPKILTLDHVNHTNNMGAGAGDLDYKAIMWGFLSGEENLFASWYDEVSGNYEMNRLGTNYSSFSAWEDVWRKPFPGLKSQFIKAKLFHEPLPSGTSIVLKAKKDGDSSFAIIATSDTDDDVQKIITNANATNKFQKGHRHKLRIEMTSSTTTKPQLEKIVLRAWNVEQN